MRRLLLGLVLCLASWPCAARADILIYILPGGGHAFQFQGEAEVQMGRTVRFRHTQFGNFYFGFDNVEIHKAPSTLSIAEKKIRKSQGDQKALLDAARWCLHHGLLDEFYQCVSAAWKLDRNDPTVQRLAKLKGKMNAELPALKEQEEQMKKYIRTTDDMEFTRSKHFLLMHNLKPVEKKRKRGEKKRQDPVQQRLELLEKVYESYLLKFYLEGSELKVPTKRLMVVLFEDKADFTAYCKATISTHMKPAGLYDKRSNIAVFYDQGTAEGFKGLDVAKKQIGEAALLAKRHRSPGTARLVRFSKSLDLVIEVAKLNRDIEVVSHECTHQMAANTGLMPNESHTPVWVAEGIATYFESPSEAAWAGIGTVNEGRLELYRAMAKDEEHSNVEFIATDNVFMCAGSHEATLHAYGQAWALTHFLMAHHFDELMEFYRLLGERKPKDKDKMFPPDENLALFKKVFGEDTKVLNAQWHRYMASLKTDVERVLEGE